VRRMGRYRGRFRAEVRAIRTKGGFGVFLCVGRGAFLLCSITRLQPAELWVSPPRHGRLCACSILTGLCSLLDLFGNGEEAVYRRKPHSSDFNSHCGSHLLGPIWLQPCFARAKRQAEKKGSSSNQKLAKHAKPPGIAPQSPSKWSPVWPCCMDRNKEQH
jgi:hypothetical protein